MFGEMNQDNPSLPAQLRFWSPLLFALALIGLLVVACHSPTPVPAPAPAHDANWEATVTAGQARLRAARANPAPAPTPVPVDPAAKARADAAALLGQAGSARASGDLGIAWELARQAVAKSPDDAEAQAFLKDVEAQKQAAEEEAAEQAYAAAHNGWTKTRSHNMGMFFWRQPNTSMLAAICAEFDLERRISWAEYARRSGAKDPQLDYLLGDILANCQRTTNGLPLG